MWLAFAEAVEAWEGYVSAGDRAAFAALDRLAKAATVPTSTLVRRHPQLQSSWRIRQHLALSLFSEGDAAESMYHAQKAYTAAPKELANLVMLARLYERFRFVDAGIQTAQQALELSSQLQEQAKRRPFEQELLAILFRLEVYINRDAMALTWLRRLVDAGHNMTQGTLLQALKVLLQAEPDPEFSTRLLQWVPVDGKWTGPNLDLHMKLESIVISQWRERLLRALRVGRR